MQRIFVKTRAEQTKEENKETSLQIEKKGDGNRGRQSGFSLTPATFSTLDTANCCCLAIWDERDVNNV